MRVIFLMIAVGCAALLLESMLVVFINWLLKPKGARRLTLIPISGGCDDLERNLRWQLFKREVDPFGCENLMLIVDCGICDEGEQIAKRLCSGKSNCGFCKADELRKIVGYDAVCKGVELVLY